MMINDTDLDNAETLDDLQRDWTLMDAVNGYVNGLRKQIVLLRQENEKLRDEIARSTWSRAEASMQASLRTVAALCVSPDPRTTAAGMIAVETGDMQYLAQIMAEQAEAKS